MGTLLIGGLALILATAFQTVLEMILHAYAFMVAGLLFPTLGAYFWSKSHPTAALISMIGGGSLTLFLIISKIDLCMGLDASFFGLCFSAMLFILISLVCNKRCQNA
jgi:SSS family solute:Na+ symporter